MIKCVMVLTFIATCGPQDVVDKCRQLAVHQDGHLPRLLIYPDAYRELWAKPITSLGCTLHTGLSSEWRHERLEQLANLYYDPQSQADQDKKAKARRNLYYCGHVIEIDHDCAERLDKPFTDDNFRSR